MTVQLFEYFHHLKIIKRQGIIIISRCSASNNCSLYKNWDVLHQRAERCECFEVLDTDVQLKWRPYKSSSDNSFFRSLFETLHSDADYTQASMLNNSADK